MQKKSVTNWLTLATHQPENVCIRIFFFASDFKLSTIYFQNEVIFNVCLCCQKNLHVHLLYLHYIVVLYFLNWKSYYDVLWYIMAKFLIHLYLLFLKIYTILQYLHQPSFHIIFLEKCKFFDRFLANILHILKKYF